MSFPPSNGKTLLITGINGYIASVLGALVLSKGYSLRGTIRRAASASPLLSGPYAAYADRVQIYEVPDMTIDGAFDIAAQGVDGIFHTASPIDFSLSHFSQMVIPAIRGSEVLLASALKSGPQLKSVVVTSSVVAIINPPPLLEPDHVYTEAEFASVQLERAIKERNEEITTPANVLYSASKTAAERKVWEFKNEHKPSFSISTINPSIVFGPPVILPSSGAQLNETLRPIFSILSSGPSAPLPPDLGSGSFVDVRDVAFMHIWAFENAATSDGERYIACAGFGPTQAVADVLNEHYQGTKVGNSIIRGTTGEGYIGFENGRVEKVRYPPGRVQISGKKAEREMGVMYISLQKSILDTVAVLERLL